MAAHSAEEMRKHVRTYMVVFAALAGLTLITVAVSYLELRMVYAIIVALFVASIKGSLVAAYFMHLISEKSAIYWILAFTAFFFAICLMLPVLTDVGMMRSP